MSNECETYIFCGQVVAKLLFKEVLHLEEPNRVVLKG